MLIFQINKKKIFFFPGWHPNYPIKYHTLVSNEFYVIYDLEIDFSVLRPLHSLGMPFLKYSDSQRVLKNTFRLIAFKSQAQTRTQKTP